ncbi:MAG: ABC transporter permease [Bacteroidales bacterium]|nr:ABC transporter permease [Bacteroidales bacterium]
MRFEIFAAKRLIKSKNSGYTSYIIRIALVAVTLCVAVMLVSLGVLTGFKDAVREKISGFGSHMQAVRFTAYGAYSDSPMKADNAVIEQVQNLKQVKNVTPVLYESGVIINDNTFHAVLLKGITSSFDTSFFHSSLTSGCMPQYSNEGGQQILISQNIADKLNINVSDRIKVQFFTDAMMRSKRFTVSGIYQTGLSDYDERFLICQSAVLENIFSLDSGACTCYEITLKDFSMLESGADAVYAALPQDMTVQTVRQAEPNLFSWLDLLDSNVVLIIVIMFLVTVVTLSGVTLILIFEKKKTVGILKTMGVKNSIIMRIFLIRIGWLAFVGTAAGNVLALVLELIEKYTDVIKLDPQSYYLTSVPVTINVFHYLVLDIAVLAVCVLCMVIPARSINKISIVKNLRFE